MRLFVAIELSGALHRPLERYLAQLSGFSRDLRFCKPEQLHLTLKFLGELDEARLGRVEKVMRRASEGVGPFEIALTGLGAFPPRGLPRVLWCGIDDPSGGCGAWVERAEAGFAKLGVPREKRAYHPHITLARSRSPAGGEAIRRLLESPPDFGAPRMRVERVTLFESRLRPSGAQYSVLRQVALGASPTP